MWRRRGKRYETEKKLEGRPSITNVIESDTKLGHDVQVVSTARKIADQTGVNEKTIRRDAQFARAGLSERNISENLLSKFG